MLLKRALLSVLLLSVFACSSPSGSADVASAEDVPAVAEDALPDLSSVDVGEVEDVAEDVTPTTPYGGFSASGAYIQDMLGVSTHMHRGVSYSWKREAELDYLEDLGFTRVRSDFYWREIEVEEGSFDVSGQAHMTDLCLERGLTLLGIIFNPPGWARENGDIDTVDPEKWRAYVQYTVGEMNGRVNHWEIWNEQNIQAFWPLQPNPEIFGDFLKIAAEEIRAINPEAEITFGGLSPFEFHVDNLWGYLMDVAAYHPDICDYFDSFAIHPYTAFQQEAPETDYEMVNYVHPSMGGLIDQARDMLAQAGCPDVPIHLTESGWPHYLMGVENQGAFAVRGLLLAAAGGASTYYWYTFWDSVIAEDETMPTECTFGLVSVPTSLEEPGEPNPSYYAMKGASLLLRGTRYAGNLGSRLDWDDHLHGLAFADDDGLFTVAAWHSLEDLDAGLAVEIPLPEGATAWTRYDHTGTEVASGTEGPVSFDAIGWVSYVQFH